MADRVTRPDLDAIEARANAATPGPWGNAGYPLRGRDGPEVMGPGDELLLTMECRPPDDADATFIAAARTDLPALVAYARELEATLANERGEGEPPVEGWRSILYNGRPRWGIDFTDDDFVVVKQVYNSIEWTFLHNHPDGRVTRVDGFQSARAAMRAASVPA